MAPRSAAPLLVLVTGNPVETAARAHGDFTAMIRRRQGGAWDGAWVAVDARTDEPLPAATAVSGVVITGSPASVTERAAWMLRAEAYLRDLVAAGVPTLGICFGHQMLAQALGGRVERNPAGREIGTVDVEVVTDHPWLGFSRGRANMTHVDSVMALPPGAESLAETGLEPNAAIRFGESCLGVQFHPEIDAAVMRHYVEARRDAIAGEGLDPDGILAGVDDGDDGGGVLRRFLADVARRPRR
jgi:GMP synthase (glutamine-hydrolysing)